MDVVEEEPSQATEGDDDEYNFSSKGPSKKFKTCSHYRRLTSKELAVRTHATCVPDISKVNCCAVGGDKSKFGTHDIEDLVKFGVQPNVKRDVAIYRDRSQLETSFGITLLQHNSGIGSVTVGAINDDGAAAREGSLASDDTIMSINGVGITPRHHVDAVANIIKNSDDPLLMDAYNGRSSDIDTNEYSSESACPYFLSRALAKRADLIFCPYNYVLDPSIRNSMEIDVQDAIVILDEAHNVEDTLRNLGSYAFKEFELIEMLPLLNLHALQWIPPQQHRVSARSQEMEEDLRQQMPEITHSIILLIEKVLKFLKESKKKFEDDKVNIGATKATAEYVKFKCPDDKEWEVAYYGPSGYGDRGKPIGCQNFFQAINMGAKDVEESEENIEKFGQFISSQSRDDSESQEQRTLADRIVEFVTSLCQAYRLSEHYFISSVVSANGNLDFATQCSNVTERRYKKDPKQIARHPKNLAPNDPIPESRKCPHTECRRLCHERHCDGSLPKWETTLIINLLTPAVHMAQLTRQCHSLVFASGSLAPLPSLCAELNLLPPDPKSSSSDPNNKSASGMSKMVTAADDVLDKVTEEKKAPGFINPFKEKHGRLQVTPKPLEANHVSRKYLSFFIYFLYT